MQSLPRKDQTRQNKNSTPTPPNLHIACPQAITLTRKHACKRNKGMVGRGRRYLRTSVYGMSTLEKSMKLSHANEHKPATNPVIIKEQQQLQSTNISSLMPCKTAMACAIISSV